MRLRSLFGSNDPFDAGARVRRETETWLDRALAGEVHLPRIPVRRVSEGGFGHMSRSPEGRREMEAWWDRTLGDDELDL